MIDDNTWGDASIDESLFDYINEICPPGGIILELGSGWGTSQLCKHWEVISIEHDIKYVEMLDNRVIHAPLTPHKAIRNFECENEWYDREVLTKELKGLDYDLLLVDGPPGTTRCGIIKYLSMFKEDVPMIFDDLQRRADMKIINSCAAKLKRRYTIYPHFEGKPFGVINDPS